MTCRVARSFHNQAMMESFYCCRCGSYYMEVFVASDAVGPYLCSICARSRMEYSAVEGTTSCVGTSNEQAGGATSSPIHQYIRNMV